MRRRLAQVVLVAALVGAAFALRGRKPTPAGPVSAPRTPEGVVSALLEAASRGDDETYLSLAEGEFLTSLLASRRDLGPGGFRESLHRTVRGVKGLAITRGAARADGRLALQVELVFADRNERQPLLLSRRGGEWVVVWMGPAQRVVPAVRYGTPVFGE